MRELLPEHGVDHWRASVPDRETELLDAAQTLPFGEKHGRVESSVDRTYQPRETALPVVVGQETDVLDRTVVVVELDFLVRDQIPDDKTAACVKRAYRLRRPRVSWTGGRRNSCRLAQDRVPPMMSWTSKQPVCAMLIFFSRPVLNLRPEVINL